MVKLFFLVFITGLKILLTKGFLLALILFAFYIKGRTIHKNETEWKNYFLKLSDRQVTRYIVVLYLIATIVSSLIGYAMLIFFKFRQPLYLSAFILIGSALFTWCQYRKKGKAELKKALIKIKESAVPEHE